MATAGGAARKICEDCDVFAFASDQEVLIQTRAPAGVFWLLDLQTREQVRLVAGDAADPRISWNQRWMAFIESDAIHVAPFGRRELKPEQGQTIARRDSNADRATGWSPDSTVLYLLLERDGFRCLYGVKIDPQSGRPQGDVFPVHHFHNARWRWGSTSRASAVVTGLVISGQYEWSGNIWMTSLVKSTRR
jgi:hypothetical protein